MGYYLAYSPGLPAIVWLRIDGDGGLLYNRVTNAAIYLLVLCYLLSIISYATRSFTTLFTGGYIHRRPGRKQRDGACTIKFRPDVSARSCQNVP